MQACEVRVPDDAIEKVDHEIEGNEEEELVDMAELFDKPNSVRHLDSIRFRNDIELEDALQHGPLQPGCVGYTARWVAFWCIPIIKFMVHSVFAFVSILVHLILLYHQADDASNVRVAADMLQQPTSMIGLEVAFWSVVFGRNLDELAELYAEGWSYLTFFFNKIDVVLALLFSIAFAVRMALISLCQMGEATDVMLITRLHYMQFDLQLWAFMLSVLRFMEMLTYHASLGEVFLTTNAMIAETLPVLVVMLVFASTTGIILHLSHIGWDTYNGDSWPNASVPALNTFHPLFAGAYALVGDMVFLENLYERKPPRDTFDWSPGVLWIEAFVTTVFLVNLIVAKMTSIYERVKANSESYRAFQMGSLIIACKDDRGAPPPLNVIVLLSKLVRPLVPQLGRQLYDSLLPAVQAEQRGFAVRMKSAEMKHLNGRERVYALKYHEQRLDDEASHTDASIAAMREDMPKAEVFSRMESRLDRCGLPKICAMSLYQKLELRAAEWGVRMS
jgi:hypothetical protein